jgi:hypothetical protein
MNITVAIDSTMIAATSITGQTLGSSDTSPT